jgi:hypothetical protein
MNAQAKASHRGMADAGRHRLASGAAMAALTGAWLLSARGQVRLQKLAPWLLLAVFLFLVVSVPVIINHRKVLGFARHHDLRFDHVADNELILQVVG